MGDCFVHASDLHLDAPLGSLGLLDKQRRADLASRAAKAWDNLVDLCIDKKASSRPSASPLIGQSQFQGPSMAPFGYGHMVLGRRRTPTAPRGATMPRSALVVVVVVALAAGCSDAPSAACVQAADVHDQALVVYQASHQVAVDAYATWEQAWADYEVALAEYEAADADFQAARKATSAARDEARAVYDAAFDAAWASAAAIKSAAYADLSEESLARHQAIDPSSGDLLEHFAEASAADDAARAKASAVYDAANEVAAAQSDAAESVYNAARDASWAEYDAALDDAVSAGKVLAVASSTADAYAAVSNDAKAARDQALQDYRAALSDETAACA